MPTGGRHDGKQVYSLGKLPLYIDPDKGLVYARISKDGFRPVTLRQALERRRRAPTSDAAPRVTPEAQPEQGDETPAQGARVRVRVRAV